MAEIKLTGINKVYPNGTHAVHDVDLHIADGEFMIMVGPSGCAKSTILRMIAGLEVPTGGTVEIGGRVVNDVAPKDRDIAMVFQSYALYPHMTVRENMAFGLRLRNMPETEIDQRVSEAARILGLELLLDRLPKQMSGGQRQRVAMGRAIVREPQCFLMDEPLSNLDAKLRVQMRTEIAKLHQRLGVTTVYVTHDQVEAMTLGQRICILRKGVVQQVDTPFMVYSNPANIFVGGFIGSPGMNFMVGTLYPADGGVWLALGDQSFPLPGSVVERLAAEIPPSGRQAVVGIRPEHLDVAMPGVPAALPVQVDLVESLGSEAYAYFRSDVAAPDLSELSDTQASASSFVARLAPGAVTARAGEGLLLVPQLEHVHLFDPQSQLTLLAPRLDPSTTADGIDLGAGPSHVVLPPHAIDAALEAPVGVVAAPTLPHHAPSAAPVAPSPVVVPTVVPPAAQPAPAAVAAATPLAPPAMPVAAPAPVHAPAPAPASQPLAFPGHGSAPQPIAGSDPLAFPRSRPQVPDGVAVPRPGFMRVEQGATGAIAPPVPGPAPEQVPTPPPAQPVVAATDTDTPPATVTSEPPAGGFALPSLSAGSPAVKLFQRSTIFGTAPQPGS